MVINLNSTIFIQMIGFLSLLFILNIILYKPVLGIIRKRKETLDSLIAKANELKSKAVENKNIYSSRLEESEIKAKEEYNNIITSAMKEKEESIKEEMDKAKEAIESEKKKVLETLNAEYKQVEHYSEDISSKIYERLVG